MKKILTAFILSAMMVIGILSSAVITVFAEDYLTEEEIIDYIWDEWWFGEPDDGTVFPESSFEHHILTTWVSENYENIKSDLSYAIYSYNNYYSDLVSEWYFADDENGHFYIRGEDDSVLYTFNFANGKWNMTDTNGNVVESFMPYSTLTDENSSYENEDEMNYDANCYIETYPSDETENYAQNNNRNDQTANSVHRVTGAVLNDEEHVVLTATGPAESEETAESGSVLPVVAVVIASVGAAGAVVFVQHYKKKK